MTAPKMTFAFWSAAPVTTSAASFTSKRPMSGPPVTLRRMPVAPSIDASSSGDETAIRAASPARFSPEATPMPISAEPASRMIVRTSAKSRLTRPGDRDQVGDALDALAQDVVGHPERVHDRRVLVDHLQQPVVLDHDQRVDVLAQVADPELGLLGALAALERERPRHDADRDRLELARELGHRRCAAGPGAAALACGDEDHVGALQRLLQLVAALVRGDLPDLRVGAGAEPARGVGSDLELHVGVRHQQRLRVGVDGDELAAGQAGVDHAVDGVRAAAADADDLEDCEEFLGRISHAHDVLNLNL